MVLTAGLDARGFMQKLALHSLARCSLGAAHGLNMSPCLAGVLTMVFGPSHFGSDVQR